MELIDSHAHIDGPQFADDRDAMLARAQAAGVSTILAIGTEIRQICAGIAQYYEPESLIGRKVAVVVNLAPRKLRGVESNGMIVAASVGPEGRPVLTGFHEEVEVGARLK